jgi:uncharacterized oligopeptide transporter (OPT) family protein
VVVSTLAKRCREPLTANLLFERFSPSLSYVGQGASLAFPARVSRVLKSPRTGIIMGFPTTISMNLGMITGWAILSPLAKHKGWAPGPVQSSTDGSRGWIVSPRPPSSGRGKF